MAFLLVSAVAILTPGGAGAAVPTGGVGLDPSPCPAGTAVVAVVCDETAFLTGSEIEARVTFDQPRAFDPARKVVPFDGMKFVSWGSSNPYWTVDGTLYRKFSEDTDNPNASVYFAGRGSVTDFGFRLHPFGYPNQFVVRVVGVDGSRTDLTLPRDTGDVYLGLSSAVGLLKVKVIQMPYRADGVAVNFGFDDVARGAITPATG